MISADSLQQHDFAFAKRKAMGFSRMLSLLFGQETRWCLSCRVPYSGSTKTVSKNLRDELIRPVAAVATEHIKIVS